MDYSQFQVKYLNTPTIEYKPIELSSSTVEQVPDISRISYLNGEAYPSTALLQEEAETPTRRSNPVRRVISNTPTFKISKGLSQFNLNFDEALKVGGKEAEELKSRRTVLTHLAQVESGFNSSIQNRTGAPAFGYFQFMQGLYKGTNHNNIGQYAGVDINTFRNSPVLQIRAANKLANSFMSSFSKTELNRLHQLGWTDNAILAGCWLGGPGNVKKLAFRGIDSSDGTDTVGKRMKKFNY